MKSNYELPTLPKPLTYEEKKYLLAVERGDIANVRRILQQAHRTHHIDMNCVDSLGRGALTIAINGENMEMVELLVILGVETKDALLHAINDEFVEAVELLLEHEEIIHKEGELYSWQKVDSNISTFSPDITPLVLAAHKNNYEIIKILLDRGATLPMPHDIKCGCDDCIRISTEDSLRHSLSRVNEYRALSSPSLMALSSSDPILTAFQLSWELRTLAFAEQECKSDYLELRMQCQQFAVDLLDQSRSSQELAIILNHDPDELPFEDGDHMKLARLEQAINYKQKKFVAHPNIQQLLASIWYEGVPGFRRKTSIQKLMICIRVALFFPMYCTLYIFAPNTPTAKLMRKPFMKFLIHASAYLFFLLILILVSLRAEVHIIQMFGTESMKIWLDEQLKRQRGQGPTYLELLVVVYVLGFIWEETTEIFLEGMQAYLRNMWNFIDFTRNSVYVGTAILRIVAYIQQMYEVAEDPSHRYIPRENWDAFDPQLIAEGLFAAANILSALKLVHLFSINPHLGPLQISLGRMVIDIVKFFFIYSLVLFAFACGLNQLLWYYAEMEKKKCYHLPGGLPDWDNNGDSCMKWRYFANVFEASQSLFWASFGMVGLESFELAGIKSYTRFWGLLMFGSYSVINVIVLLNLLIAMMSNSYAIIEEHSDTEWKFARTRLWMSYFEESATLPPPFNIMPTPKLMFKMLGLRKKDKLKQMSSKVNFRKTGRFKREGKEKERDIRYTAVMRALVWRYVSAMHRKMEEDVVTEDDINEVKGDISAMRYELLEVFERNGMDISSSEKKEKTVLGRNQKVWERRLMKDFQVAPISAMEEETPAEAEDNPLSKFRRIARLAVNTSSSYKWGQVVEGAVCQSSQIGRCHNREAYKNQQNLQRAMEEARKLVLKSPLPGMSRAASPTDLPVDSGENLMSLLKDISADTGGRFTPTPLSKTPTPSEGKSLGISGSKSPALGLSALTTQLKEKSPAPTPRGPTPTPSGKISKTPIVSRSPSPQKDDDTTSPPEIASPVPSIASPPPLISIDSPPLKPEDIPSIASPTGDETPLIPIRRTDGDSPPKVIKRKAPGIETSVSRPAAPEIPPQSTPGAIPPPPAKVKTRPPTPQPAEPTPEPSRIQSPIPVVKVTEPEPATPSEEESTSAMISVPSTESLIKKDEEEEKAASPEPLRPVRKIEDVSTIKRQPKTGWL
ncbi:transient-receptor-potential-like protein [Chrysoperla carnea]|uniref:transient-receptor-potential-like protein n=1 Tax=Chrysoperla carnea TaxID=189513 RepID=UPI001D077B4D|nr:transient-receptor-potential-like protein [Chrysoperla carnea]